MPRLIPALLPLLLALLPAAARAGDVTVPAPSALTVHELAPDEVVMRVTFPGWLCEPDRAGDPPALGELAGYVSQTIDRLTRRDAALVAQAAGWRAQRGLPAGQFFDATIGGGTGYYLRAEPPPATRTAFDVAAGTITADGGRMVEIRRRDCYTGAELDTLKSRLLQALDAVAP